MSDKLKMLSVDKVELRIAVHCETFIKLKKAQKSAGVSLNAICAALLDEAVADVEWTLKDEQDLKRQREENLLRREAQKKRKGLI